MGECEGAPFGAMIDDANVLKLVSECFSGNASEAQFSELSELIVHSPKVRDFYLAHSALHYQLLTYSLPLEDPQGIKSVTDASKDGQTRLLLMKRLAALAASVVLALVGAYMWTSTAPEATTVVESSSPSVGNLKRTPQTPGKAESREILPGRPYELSEGSFDLVLTSGVEVSIAAPASFTCYSPMEMRLFRGRLAARVPEAAKGFTVMTNQANIVDQGTEFGVAVGENELTDVAVFDGQVDVATSRKKLSLVLGKAVSVASSGDVSRLSVVQPDTFKASHATSDEPGPTILSISDNIRADDSLDYYQIVHRGFNEDQRAYVDRHHQWNGVSAEGLPEFLIGADYVLPFNSDKHAHDMTVTVTLSKKAYLYVLFDTRLAAPQWLVDGFDDIGINVGQDEVHPNRPAQRGAARSIDRLFTVWQSKSAVTGDVSLGSLIEAGEESKEERSMYGILAVPYEPTDE